MLQPDFQWAILKEVREGTSLVHLTVDWQARIETYNSWTWENAEDCTKPMKPWVRFEKHVVPKINHRLARYQL